MNVNLTDLLHVAEQALDSETANKAASLLRDSETRLVDGAPTREEVRQLLPTLRARLANSANTGKRIFGLDRMVARLEVMDSAAPVIGYGFISPRAAGNFYLAGDGRQMLGATIVDR